MWSLRSENDWGDSTTKTQKVKFTYKREGAGVHLTTKNVNYYSSDLVEYVSQQAEGHERGDDAQDFVGQTGHRETEEAIFGIHQKTGGTKSHFAVWPTK